VSRLLQVVNITDDGGVIPKASGVVDWVGLFRPNVPVGSISNYLRYKFITDVSVEHSAIVFKVSPKLYGEVQLRYIQQGTRNPSCVGVSNVLHIGPKGELVRTEDERGIHVAWYQTQGAPLQGRARVALYRVGAMDDDWLQNRPVVLGQDSVTRGDTTFSPQMHAASESPFEALQEAGAFEFRLFCNAPLPVGVSETWDVQGPGSLQLTIGSTPESLLVCWDLSDIFDPDKLDWVGVYRLDEPAAFLFYKRGPLRRSCYVDTPKGSREYRMSHGGRYEARVVRSNGTVVLRSKQFQLTSLAS